MVAWNAPRVKVQLRLATQRLKTLREKKESVAKAARRDIATLLERGKVETARIKTESIINDDIHVELLELLELYCEILFARFGLIENSNAREPDPGVSEAILGIVYSAHRTEVKELHYIRESFMHRYGRDWSIAVMDNAGNRVSARVLNKVTNETPSPALVDAYLAEIARGYNLDWTPAPAPDLLNTLPDSADIFELLESSEVQKQELSGKSLEVSDGGALPKPVSTPRSGVPPPYSGTVPQRAKVHKDDDDDDNNDLLRRFQALSNRK